MKFHAPSILAVFILTTDIGVGPGLGAEAEANRQKDGKRDAAAAGIIVHDSLVNLLPFEVAKTYKDLFPEHRIWQCSHTGKGDSARYELTIFHPGDTSVHGVDVGAAHVQTWFNWKLVLGSTGEVIREQAHPVPENTIPAAARKAFQEWSKPFPRGGPFDTEWSAGKEEGAQRLYKVAVILNSVEWYRATLRADGTFLDKDSRFQPKRAAPPDK